MEVPSYKPLAGTGERRMPQYTPIVWREEQQKPFDSFKWSNADDNASEASHDDDLVAPLSTLSINNQPSRASRTPASSSRSRFPLITSRTFPTCNHDPWSAIRRSQAFDTANILSPPNYASSILAPLPEYASMDSQGRTFRLQAPFIHASKTSNLPQYQVKQELDRAGKPSSLKMRRLRPHETRACSVPAIHAARGPRIQYDDDETLYTMTGFELQGNADSDLPGTIQITSGRTLWGGSWTKIWHVTKPHPQCQTPLRRDSWSSDFDAKSHGRKPRSRLSNFYEGDKMLLYSVRKGVWEDAEGTFVAREEKSKNGKVLEMSDVWARDAGRRDLVVACWIMRVWMGEGLKWD